MVLLKASDIVAPIDSLAEAKIEQYHDFSDDANQDAARSA